MNKIEVIHCSRSQNVVLIDGNSHSQGPSLEQTKAITVKVGSAIVKTNFLVSHFPNSPVILSFPWICETNSLINWCTLELNFQKTILVCVKCACVYRSQPL